MPVQIGAKAHDFSDPTGLLSDCHRRIEMFLGSLQRVAELNDSPLTAEARVGLRFAPSPSQSGPRNEFVLEPLLDSDEAAELLRIHPKTLQRMARNRQIHGIQVGKLWRLRASDLEIWLRAKKAG